VSKKGESNADFKTVEKVIKSDSQKVITKRNGIFPLLLLFVKIWLTIFLGELLVRNFSTVLNKVNLVFIAF
jgi:hypothetical protein